MQLVDSFLLKFCHQIYILGLFLQFIIGLEIGHRSGIFLSCLIVFFTSLSVVGYNFFCSVGGV
jgi:hypothetical protein